MKPGYIDRHGKGFSARVKQTPEPTADLLIYILVKAVNHIFSLEYRNEAVRRNNGAGLGLPADQSLCTADFSCCKVHLWLVIDRELSVFKGSQHPVFYVFFFSEVAADTLIIINIILLASCFNCFSGKIGPVQKTVNCQ